MHVKITLTKYTPEKLTMKVVRMSPGVIRSQNEGVCNEANNVIDRLIVGQRAVTSIMPYAEDGAPDKTLEEPVR